MNNLKQFLIWHWKKFKFSYGASLLLSLIGTLSGLLIAEYSVSVGGWIILLSITLLGLTCLKMFIWDSIKDSYLEFKEEQRKTFDVLNDDEFGLRRRGIKK